MYRQLAALTLFTLLSIAANAAVVTKVSGEQVLIDLQGDSSFSEGGRYLVMVGDKKRAVVEITKVKGARALGKVLKGTAVAQGTLAPLPGGGGGGGGSPKSNARASRRSRRSMIGSLTIGGLVGYGSTSQTVKITQNGATEDVSMTGSSISVKGFGDLPISGAFGVLGRAGIENFGVAGNRANGAAVETKIMYLTADVLLRYNLMEGNLKPFPLLGMGLHYPLSKSSGVLDPQRISATTLFFVGGGLNYTLSESMYLHATAEYCIFPPSNDVKTSLIAGRVGIGFNM